MKLLMRIGSMQFAFWVMGVIVIACIAGTLWPGADVFHAPWFFLLTVFLVLSLIVCGIRQARSLRKVRGAALGRRIGSLLLHVSLLAILLGAAIRGVFGQRGMLALHTGQTAESFTRDSKSFPLPFSLTLLRFSIDTQDSVEAKIPGRLLVRWPGDPTPQIIAPAKGGEHTVRPKNSSSADPRFGTIKVIRYVPEFTLDRRTRTVSSLSDEPNNPALQIEVSLSGFVGTNWVFANFPGFRMPGLSSAPDPFQVIYDASSDSPSPSPIKNFRSTVSIAENGHVVHTGDIAVNAPLRWRGYVLYQSGYDPSHHGWSSLLVVRDPGVPVVFAGFAMLLTGLFLVLFVWPEVHSA